MLTFLSIMLFDEAPLPTTSGALAQWHIMSLVVVSKRGFTYFDI